jgi:AraC-like DNA-binding protein
LLQTSDIPVKQIASSIGMPDLQVFNKAVRLTFGVSPRALRRPDIRSEI